ncbi:DUF1285 domain-containing protein [Spongiibacter marinus]|jgi:hypothetical protein|uniref:DUF1285 domain-containing protein n=1 Tax=Spongiibacter marinus TaxID=354246 RepID=UPI002E8AB020|nr:DUF1285 domain-containing protein [Pseudomonadota bacterium]
MSSLETIERLLRDQAGRPPIEKWQPALSGEIDIQILADGRWIHEGGEIKRHELVKLFASILRCEADGHYYLVTPVEKWRLQVEDLPLLIVDMEVGESTSEGRRIAVKTNVDTWHELGPQHRLSVTESPDSGEPRPAVALEHGLSARVNRACFYRLVDLAEQHGDRLIVRSAGEQFELGRV